MTYQKSTRRGTTQYVRFNLRMTTENYDHICRVAHPSRLDLSLAAYINHLIEKDRLRVPVPAKVTSHP